MKKVANPKAVKSIRKSLEKYSKHEIDRLREAVIKEKSRREGLKKESK